MRKFIQKIKNFLIKAYTVEPSEKEDAGNAPLCPKCQRGYLLEIPKEDSSYKYICERCYMMVSAQELEVAIKNSYVDTRSEEQKYFDTVLEQQNRSNPINKEMIRRGKRIVEALKQYKRNNK